MLVTIFTTRSTAILSACWVICVGCLRHSLKIQLVRAVAALFGLMLLSACGSPEKTAGLLVGVTALGAQAPANEIQQTYYLGVFDPEEQVEPTVYRVRVHGQASFISFAKFASGWVPAEVADSLSSSISFNKETNAVTIDENGAKKSFKTGRRMVVFGPEPSWRKRSAPERL
jgi:hypothetical protein